MCEIYENRWKACDFDEKCVEMCCSQENYPKASEIKGNAYMCEKLQENVKSSEEDD